MLVSDYIKRELVRLGKSEKLEIASYSVRAWREGHRVLYQAQRVFAGPTLIDLNVTIAGENLIGVEQIGVLRVRSMTYTCIEGVVRVDIDFYPVVEADLFNLE